MAVVVVTKKKHSCSYHSKQPEKHKLVHSFYVCMQLCWTTPENLRLKSTSCFWDKVLHSLNFLFWEKQHFLKLKINKIHIKCTIFSQKKDHLDQRPELNKFLSNAAFLYSLSQNQNFHMGIALREKCPCGISLLIQSKCGKIRTRKTPNTDTFHEYFKEDENMKHFLFDLILQVNLFSPSIPFLYFWCFQGYIEMEHCQNLVLNNHGMLRSSINKIKIFAYVWLLYICNISHQSSRYFQCQELMR